jgi:hypothetical protein
MFTPDRSGELFLRSYYKIQTHEELTNYYCLLAGSCSDGGAEGADVLLGVRARGEARADEAAWRGLGGGGRGDGEGDGDGVRGPAPRAQGGAARGEEGGVLAQPGPAAALHQRQGLLPRRGVLPPHLQLLPPRLQRRQARPAPGAAARRRPRRQHVQRRRRQRVLHHVVRTSVFFLGVVIRWMHR